MTARFAPTPLLAMLLLVASACAGGDGRGGDPPSPDAPAHEEHDGDAIVLTEEAARASGLQTVVVALESFHPHLLVSGVIRPDAARQVVVRARQAGRLTEVVVDVGAKVRAGDLLGRMEGPEVTAAMARRGAAVARETAAGEALTRADRLLELQAISRAERDQRAADATAARAEAAAARQDLARMGLEPDAVHADDRLPSLPVRAPIAGTVLARNVSTGLAVAANQALFEIADLGRLWAVADVHERDIGRVTGGDVEVRSDAYPDELFAGTIALVEPTLDEQSRTAHVRVLLGDTGGRLRPGMFVTVAVPTRGVSEAPVATVPVAALQSVSGLPVVFVEEAPGRFRLRAVEIGDEAHGRVEILGGLQPGESVVTEGAFVLKSELLKSTIGGDEH